MERLQHASMYDNVRKAAEVHRQVRRYAQSFIKPGIKLIDMCTMLEEKVGRRGWPAVKAFEGTIRELFYPLASFFFFQSFCLSICGVPYLDLAPHHFLAEGVNKMDVA